MKRILFLNLFLCLYYLNNTQQFIVLDTTKATIHRDGTAVSFGDTVYLGDITEELKVEERSKIKEQKNILLIVEYFKIIFIAMMIVLSFVLLYSYFNTKA